MVFNWGFCVNIPRFVSNNGPILLQTKCHHLNKRRGCFTKWCSHVFVGAPHQAFEASGTRGHPRRPLNARHFHLDPLSTLEGICVIRASSNRVVHEYAR